MFDKINIELGTSIHVGGASGKISKIEHELIYVSGVYSYNFQEGDNFPLEPWTNVYNFLDLKDIEPWVKLKTHIIWDASKIECVKTF